MCVENVLVGGRNFNKLKSGVVTDKCCAVVWLYQVAPSHQDIITALQPARHCDISKSARHGQCLKGSIRFLNQSLQHKCLWLGEIDTLVVRLSNNSRLRCWSLIWAVNDTKHFADHQGLVSIPAWHLTLTSSTYTLLVGSQRSQTTTLADWSLVCVCFNKSLCHWFKKFSSPAPPSAPIGPGNSPAPDPGLM